MNSGLHDGLRSFERKQRLVAVLILLLMISLSVVYTHLYRTGQAAESARLLTRMLHLQDRREAVLTLQGARLDHFRRIRFVSERPDLSFTLPEISELLPRATPWHSLVYDTVTIPLEMSGQDSASVSFDFNRFVHVPWAVLIFLLMNLISLPQIHLMKKRLIAQYERDLELDKKSSRLEIANIVRHNIRTPLSALLRLSSTVNFRDQREAEIFQSVIEQIRTLVSKLDMNAPAARSVNKDGFFEAIQTATREIQAGLPSTVSFDVSLDDSIPSVQVSFIDAELKAILGNLVNNSVEALMGPGQIRLRAQDLGHSVILEIEDDGRGISPDLLNRVTDKGFTLGKPGGTGIGLFHAKQCVEEWGGEIRIHSVHGKGTTIELRFPVQGRSSWYTSRIKLRNDSAVVIVDDQISIHRLWKMRLEEAGFTGQISSFTNAEEFQSSLSRVDADKTVYLMDYDLLDDETTGLHLLEMVPNAAMRYLITGHFDDSKVRLACERNRVALIPKTSLHSIPLIIA